MNIWIINTTVVSWRKSTFIMANKSIKLSTLNFYILFYINRVSWENRKLLTVVIFLLNIPVELDSERKHLHHTVFRFNCTSTSLKKLKLKYVDVVHSFFYVRPWKKIFRHLPSPPVLQKSFLRINKVFHKIFSDLKRT